ncbi:radical SAM protein [Streptomyces sp. NPDC057424]|uniref:SPL family radical SAM protein n=1 Tax=Streptomyces sp. NPDC057424 TaxID=3346127 RepID=UPI0036A0698F
MEPVEIEAKTLIQKSQTPSNDYVINPYTGCVLGRAYCFASFASFAGRRFGRSVKEWGDYLYVKTNEVELARKEPAKMPEEKRRGTMLLGSVTDPYQGHETKYRLTGGILRELETVEYPGLVRILTKSPVVTRDIDLLTGLPRAEVGMTVTTTDDKVSRWLEVRAHSPPAACAPWPNSKRRPAHLRLRRPAPAALRHPARAPGRPLRPTRGRGGQ